MIYEYKCIGCGNVFEEVRLAAERDFEALCPACGSSADRQISRDVAVHFKGNGFYTTDYKRKERNETPKA